MQTFSMFFSEDAGDKFKAMSDDQFEDWKKNNPGAAAKADQLRKGAKGSAIVKSGTPTANYKKVLADKAKKIAADKAKQLASKAGGALVKKGKETIANKIRKKDMGKWSQGIKNSPEKLKAGEKDRFDNRQDEKQNIGKGGTDTAYAGGKYPKVRKPDPRLKGMEKLKNDTKKKGFRDNLKDRWDDSIFRNKKKQADAVYDAPGKLASFIARNMRSSVRGDDRVSYGSDLGPV